MCAGNRLGSTARCAGRKCLLLLCLPICSLCVLLFLSCCWVELGARTTAWFMCVFLCVFLCSCGCGDESSCERVLLGWCVLLVLFYGWARFVFFMTVICVNVNACAWCTFLCVFAVIGRNSKTRVYCKLRVIRTTLVSAWPYLHSLCTLTPVLWVLCSISTQRFKSLLIKTLVFLFTCTANGLKTQQKYNILMFNYILLWVVGS